VGAALVRIAAVAAGMARSGGSAPGASVSGRFEKTWRAPARRSRAQLRPRPGQARGGRKGEEALRAAGGDYRRVPEGAEILDGGGGGACGATRCRVWGVGRGVLAATDLEGRDEHVGAHVAERAGRDVVVDHGLQSLLGEGRAEGRVPPRGFRREDVLPHAPDRPPALSQCPPRLRSRTACTAQTPPSPRTKRAHEAPSCGTSRYRVAQPANTSPAPPPPTRPQRAQIDIEIPVQHASNRSASRGGATRAPCGQHEREEPPGRGAADEIDLAEERRVRAAQPLQQRSRQQSPHPCAPRARASARWGRGGAGRDRKGSHRRRQGPGCGASRTDVRSAPPARRGPRRARGRRPAARASAAAAGALAGAWRRTALSARPRSEGRARSSGTAAGAAAAVPGRDVSG